MEQMLEAQGMPPAWVMDPRAKDHSSEGHGSHAISARFFLGPDPRGNEVGDTIIGPDGSVPIVEMVEIINRNDPKSSMTCISTDFHRYKRREEGGFPEEYRAFKAGLDMQATGIPLTEWLGDNERTRNLASFNIFTVEHLTSVSDGMCKTLGAGTYDLRKRAKAFLAFKADSAIAERAMAENAALQREMAEMKAALALLTAQSQQASVKSPEQHIERYASEDLPPPPEKRGPGRPRVTQEN